MSFVGDLLGVGDSGKGMGFSAQRANILQPTNMNQINDIYGQSQQGLNDQAAFLNALQGQNGIQNQSNIFAQQQALANQLQGVADGTGPNPALAQLANTTGQNVANQAALMAGQRGSNANAGLIARQASMQGGNLQQQAVGQGAALQAQQQLSAMNALQNQQNMMGGMANSMVGQQANALMGLNQARQSEQGQLLGALGNYNNANVAMQGNMNSANAGIANTTAQGQQGLFGGLLGNVGAGLHLFKAKGGMVSHYDEGGEVVGPQSFAGKFLKGWSGNMASTPMAIANSQNGVPNQGATQLQSGMNKFGSGLGSAIGSLFSSHSNSVGSNPGILNAAADIGMLAFKKGGDVQGKVPGKASVMGDSLQNDKVPAMLSPGEVVIPRHVMQSKDPVKNAAKFVAAVIAKKGGKNAAQSRKV